MKKRIILTVLTVAVIAAVSVTAVLIIGGAGKREMPAANYILKVASDEKTVDGNLLEIKYPEITFTDKLSAKKASIEFFSGIEYRYHDSLDISVREGTTYSFSETSLETCLQSGDYVSYVTVGSFTDNSTGDTSSFVHSVNADVKNSTTYSFDDLIGDKTAFEDAFLNGRFSLDTTETDLPNESCDGIVDLSAEFGIFPDICFDGDDICVVCKTPEAAGGYALYKMPITRAKGFLNTECDLIAFILDNN